ncbi:MAG TPA: hypothetical protein VFW27_33200 [Actinoplanes sp.]|nr:hypothetical protein [Actinoplanes sp.]
MTAYTDATKMAAYLGTTFDAGQQTQAGVMADAATAWIDGYLGQSWQAGSPVADEMHTLAGNRVYLNHRPVASVSSVKTRAASFVAFDWTTLDSSQYELLDAQNGLLLIEGWSASSAALVQVSYTHTAALPADVALAATMIASAWMSSHLAGGPVSGIESIGVGQGDIAIKYGSGTNVSDVPKEALTILNGHRVIAIA